MAKGFTEDAWKQLWQTSDGRAFKAALALMFTQCRPNAVPSEGDARAYYLNIRDIVDDWGMEAAVEGMQAAANTTGADQWRPSAGMVRAQTLKAAVRISERRYAERALPAKPYEPPTEEQLNEMQAQARKMPGDWGTHAPQLGLPVVRR